MKKPINVMSLDNSFTFGGAIISLYHMLKGIDKSLIMPVVVSGQPVEYLEKKFSDCICYHSIPKLMWVNNSKYLKLKKLWLFRRSHLLFRCLNMARFCYWLLFIIFPEALKYYRIGRRHQVAVVHLNNGYSHLPWIIAAKLCNQIFQCASPIHFIIIRCFKRRLSCFI